MNKNLAELEAAVAAAANPRQQVDALNRLAWWLIDRAHDVKRVPGLVQEAYELAQTNLENGQPYRQGMADSLTMLADYLRSTGQYGSAITHAAKALAIYEEIDSVAGRPSAYYVLGVAYGMLGDYTAALNAHTNQFQTAQASGNQVQEAIALQNIGVTHSRLGQYEEALTYYERALKRYQASGEKGGEAAVYNNCSVEYRLLGQLETSLAYAHKSLALFTEAEHINGQTRASGNVGLLYLDLGHEEEAATYLAQSYHLAQTTGSKFGQINALLYRGKLHRQQAQIEPALASIRQALELAEETGIKAKQYECHEELANVYEAGGDLQQALAHYRHFHRLKEETVNEESLARLRNLEVLHRTQQAQAEAEQQKRLREQDRLTFERLSHLKDELMSTASHDLKNPLSVISNSLFLLQVHGRLDDERGQGYLQVMGRSVQQMNALISNLLDLALFESERDLAVEFVGLADFFQVVMEDYRPVAQGKNIALLLRPFPPDWAACCNGKQLRQVVDNLISNAIKYTNSGGQVEIQVERQENKFLIKVADTGMGIPKSDLDHVFDRFYRVNHKQHQAVEGTGLGLAITKTIVEQHGGNIWVESQLGQGSVFTFTLPLYLSKMDWELEQQIEK
jgi:signal transduction histidine kinase